MNDKNLSQIILSAPSGTLFTTTFLEKHGVSSKLTWWYVRSGLLERFGPKAYTKKGDTINWCNVVSALQNQLMLPLHIGGLSALRLLKLQEEVRSYNNSMMLFANLDTKPPSWLNNLKTYYDFEIHKTSLFNVRTFGIDELKIEGEILKVSCMERAVMEVLYLSPKYLTLFDTLEITEALENFDHERVQSLLEICQSIKVKRFFLYYADRFWPKLVNKLNLKKINLGEGKRMIGRGGTYRYHPKYMLSLPEKIEE